MSMVRKLELKDIQRVMEIWLDTNIKAHDFIPEKYWISHFEKVKEMLPQAEVYVYEDENDHEIQGFIGMSGDYIAGIFVWHETQSQGIGRHLLEHAKALKEHLTLQVYQKNERAVKFYQREGFAVQHEKIDAGTGEKEFFMLWRK